MTDRGLPIVDGAPACPFVAFEDDRDERATSPDHRHRCYAELSPAPRALAHQEAYCLASAFPVCPTFQDWARREAARARATAGGTLPPASDETPRRNPPRDWSAPPPWAGGSGGAPGVGAGLAAAAVGDEVGRGDVNAPDFLSNRARPDRGLAGSAADRLAGGADEPRAATPRALVDDDDDEEGLVAGAAPTRVSAEPPPAASRERPASPAPEPPPVDDSEDDDWDDEDEWEEAPPARRASADRARGPLGDRRPKVGDTRRRREPDQAPSWERPRRYEAYPTLKTRVGLSLPSFSSFPRIGVMALALVVAAIALFFLPALLGVGGPDDEGGSSPSPSLAGGAASPSVAPTATPAPTPIVYVVQPGDTLSRIANEFGVSLADLIEANRETLPNPDVLAIGDQLIIPTPPAEELPGGSVEPSAAAP